MKLSEAIREGAKKRPQVYDRFFDTVPCTVIMGSCALGAAYEGLTGWASETIEPIVGRLELAFPEVRNRVVAPVLERERSVLATIVGLNDSEHWTREQIADWLESEGL